MSKPESNVVNLITQQARIARAAIVSMTTLSASGHPGGSMSSIDILLSLYQRCKLSPQNPGMPDRDRIVVSNGHISPAVYSALAINGFFELDDAISYFRLAGSMFEGHIERDVPGVEWSSGNLGQGLSAAAGMALASKINSIPYRVYTLMGDGEQQKGQICEARKFAVKYKLANLCAIIDYNQLQISGSIHDVMPQNIRMNWEADGWHVLEINGHDIEQIMSALDAVEHANVPTMILAHTVMGKGVSFMENQAKYHGSTLSEDQLAEALKELEIPNRMKEYKKFRDTFRTKTPEHKTQFALDCTLHSGQPQVYDKDTDNRSAWGNAIADLAGINKDNPVPIAVLDCDLAGSVKTADFAGVMPERFIQCGIMEHNTAVVAGALSTCGIQTFWADFGMFGLAEVYNMQRLNDINQTNLKVVLTHVGLDVGEDGKTHQSIDYIGLTRNLYDFRLICPADPNHTDRIIRWLINKPGNYVITMGRSKLPILRTEDGSLMYPMDHKFEYGKADVLRLGNMGTVFVTGTPVAKALKAVDTLRDEGVYLQLVYVSCPLEMPTDVLEMACRSGIIFSVEDHNVHTGLGTVIADRMVQEGLSAKLIKMGVKQYPASGNSEALYRMASLDAVSITETIRTALK